MKQIKITRPDDWHLHLRQGKAMSSVVGMTARQMGRAIVMPNLSPPVKTAEQAIAYREKIISALPRESDFNPLMTIYLTDNTTKQDIVEEKARENTPEKTQRKVPPSRKGTPQTAKRNVKVGRNDPCPCGSGKKYKQCHG